MTVSLTGKEVGACASAAPGWASGTPLGDTPLGYAEWRGVVRQGPLKQQPQYSVICTDKWEMSHGLEMKHVLAIMAVSQIVRE